MENWKYFQLIASFYKGFINLIGQGVALNEALNRTFDDHWFFPEEKNVISNLVVLIQFIETKFSLEKIINNELIELFYLQTNKLSKIELEEHLDLGEIEHLKESIDEVKYKIRMMNQT